MTVPTILVLADAEHVSRTAVQEFVRLARDATVARSRFSVALSGGSTPRRLYELVAAPPFCDQVEWPQVEFFWGDERAVAPDHPDSNFGIANAALLAKLHIPRAHIHRMPAERADRDAAAREYQAEIARVLGVSPSGQPPQFDLVLLGMGTDAHTASLFPHGAALRESTRWVVPSDAPGLATPRLTLTPVIINRAAVVMFLVAGADKAPAVAEVLEGPTDPERLPVQLICPTAGTVLWLLDRAAASRLVSVGAGQSAG